MNRSFVFALAIALVAACSTKEMEFQTPVQEDVVFYASFEQPSDINTRVYANEDLLLRWTAEDRVSIFNKNTYNQEYQFIGETGDYEGGFNKIGDPEFITGKEIPHVVSVYPFQRHTRVSEDEVVTVTLPAFQSYAENSFGLGDNTMVSVSSGNLLEYKNVGGYLILKLYGEGIYVSSITLKGNNSEKIAGEATVTMPLDEVPTVAMADNAAMEITLTCPEPIALGATAEESSLFWFVVPPVTFSKGFSITVKDYLGGSFEKSTSKSVTIDRNRLSKMSPMEVVPDYDNAFVSFEDDRFKAYCKEHFDLNGDGEISVDEAKQVTKIDIGGGEWSSDYPYWVSIYNITSLRGLEYFCNLTELFCSNNQLTSLDVSKNAALESLFCSNNQLTSLDVSKNTALESLGCEDNQLTSLDVSKNAALLFLNCSSNQLTSLDVSKNAALMEMGCSNNRLTSLDVSNNTPLVVLRCSNNQLTNLELSGCTTLQELESNNNLLTSLDLSGCTALEILDNRVFAGNPLSNLNVSGCTSLQYLACVDNQLTTLDVSGCTALVRLDCQNNQLTHLDVSECSTLTVFEFSGNPLTSLDASGCTALTDLVCQETQLISLDASGCTALMHLVCEESPLTSLDVSGCTALTQLSCIDNRLVNLDVSTNTALTSLDCSGNQLTNLNVSTNTALASLSCCYNQLTSLDVSTNSALTELLCYGNSLLTEIWLKTGQTISTFEYDEDIATVKYKD